MRLYSFLLIRICLILVTYFWSARHHVAVGWVIIPNFNYHRSQIMINQKVYTKSKETMTETRNRRIIMSAKKDSASYENNALRLEMSWKMNEAKEKYADDCEILSEAPDCGGDIICEKCDGVGHHNCRFCLGTNFMYMAGNFVSCKVCNDGIENCSPCRGTGFLAPWAVLSDKNKNGNTDLMP